MLLTTDSRGDASDRIFVTLKYAQTLDGRIATSDGQSQWISGSETLKLAHELRAEHQAVLVGVGTVLEDNPQLTTRLSEGADPLRVVVDSGLKTPPSSFVLSTNPGNTLIATTLAAPPERRILLETTGARILQVPAAENRVDLQALLRELYQLGVSSVLVEGGAGIITAFLRLRLVDELIVVVAPKIIGSGLEAVGDVGIRDIARAIRLGNLEIEKRGADLIFRGQPKYP